MSIRRLVALALAGCMAGVVAARAANDDSSFEKIERGRHLAVLGDCVACHTAPGGTPFAGDLALQTPFGALVGPNITPDRETGIGTWTEAEFLRTMYEGIGKNGIHLYPAMPYPAYTKVTREDASAIWAYLHTLEPVRNPVETNQLQFPLNVRRPATSVWNLANFHPGAFQSDPTKSETWNRGAYLVEWLGHCRTCHTPKTITGGDREGDFLRGSVLENWYAPNLTTGARTGISAWSVEEIVRYLKTGANSFDLASGSMADVVRNSTSKMTDADLRAIATFLKEEGTPRAAAQVTLLAADNRRMVAGKAIYDDRCGACRSSSGVGIPMLFPRLAQAPLVQAENPTSLIRFVLIGSRAGATAAAPTMPSFAWNLRDEDVAAVLTYICNVLGNVAAAVQPEDVTGLRDRLQREAAAEGD